MLQNTDLHFLVLLTYIIQYAHSFASSCFSSYYKFEWCL